MNLKKTKKKKFGQNETKKYLVKMKLERYRKNLGRISRIG
jgi:hypothetical protein